jgi:hypothetical protein
MFPLASSRKLATRKRSAQRRKLHFEASQDVLSIAWLTTPVEVDYCASIFPNRNVSERGGLRQKSRVAF